MYMEGEMGLQHMFVTMFDLSSLVTEDTTVVVSTTKELIHMHNMCDLYNTDNCVKQEILKISSLLVSQNSFKFQNKHTCTHVFHIF